MVRFSIEIPHQFRLSQNKFHNKLRIKNIKNSEFLSTTTQFSHHRALESAADAQQQAEDAVANLTDEQKEAAIKAAKEVGIDFDVNFTADQKKEAIYFGSQGWEYMELGRFFQDVLLAGFALWIVIMFRAV